MSVYGVMLASFLTASVEWVEAFTIVLAVALSIGWRRAGTASLAAFAVLALMTLASGFFLRFIADAHILQFIIGMFLVLFGLRWLAKAIARGAGLKKLHDEAEEFAALRADAKLHDIRAGQMVAFQGVMMEGLEVWLIVVALGVQTGRTGAAAGAAIAALLVVMAAGAMLRKPLANVPENTIKFFVGSAILSFGTFWVLESIGYIWPLGDFALPALLLFYAAGGLLAMKQLDVRKALS
ncbi:MAG: hypothetical protein B7Z78_04425 [Rhodospirillales bacterium 20-60-12]|nr:MAG: hypothetical protein B7Z78_04425 [Rhodospirillales bacterium 20-60-12]HQT67793.1 hypothetical protein [Acetobacteraceae bacterium]